MNEYTKSECEGSGPLDYAAFPVWQSRQLNSLPLLVKMLREIIETQKTRDMCSGPGPYGAFDPAGIAERILKETKDA